MQTSPCASENTEFSLQSTPATDTEAAIHAVEEQAEDLWSEWPYCWAIDLYDECTECFHSFHQFLLGWNLARLNKHNQREFQTQYWNQWQRDAEDGELELRLV